MQNTMRTALSVAALAVAAFWFSLTAAADSASVGVIKRRFGTLHRNDMVVSDVTGVDGVLGTGDVVSIVGRYCDTNVVPVLSAIGSFVGSLSNRLAAADSSISGLTVTITDFGVRLSGICDDLDSRFAGIGSRVSDAESGVQRLDSRVGSLENTVSTQVRGLAELSDRVSALSSGSGSGSSGVSAHEVAAIVTNGTVKSFTAWTILRDFKDVTASAGVVVWDPDTKGGVYWCPLVPGDSFFNNDPNEGMIQPDGGAYATSLDWIGYSQGTSGENEHHAYRATRSEITRNNLGIAVVGDLENAYSRVHVVDGRASEALSRLDDIDYQLQMFSGAVGWSVPEQGSTDPGSDVSPAPIQITPVQRLDYLDSRYSSLVSSHNSLARSHASLSNRVDGLSDSISSSQTRISTLERKYSTLSTNVRVVDSNLRTLAAQVELLSGVDVPLRKDIVTALGGVTYEELRTGFLYDWKVETEAVPEFDLVPRMVDGTGGMWALFNASTTNSSAEFALSDAIPGGAAAISLEWPAGANDLGALVTATRTRVPTMADITALGSRIDELAIAGLGVSGGLPGVTNMVRDVVTNTSVVGYSQWAVTRNGSAQPSLGVLWTGSGYRLVFAASGVAFSESAEDIPYGSDTSVYLEFYPWGTAGGAFVARRTPKLANSLGLPRLQDLNELRDDVTGRLDRYGVAMLGDASAEYGSSTSLVGRVDALESAVASGTASGGSYTKAEVDRLLDQHATLGELDAAIVDVHSDAVSDAGAYTDRATNGLYQSLAVRTGDDVRALIVDFIVRDGETYTLVQHDEGYPSFDFLLYDFYSDRQNHRLTYRGSLGESYSILAHPYAENGVTRYKVPAGTILAKSRDGKYLVVTPGENARLGTTAFVFDDSQASWLPDVWHSFGFVVVHAAWDGNLSHLQSYIASTAENPWFYRNDPQSFSAHSAAWHGTSAAKKQATVGGSGKSQALSSGAAGGVVVAKQDVVVPASGTYGYGDNALGLARTSDLLQLSDRVSSSSRRIDALFARAESDTGFTEWALEGTDRAFRVVWDDVDWFWSLVDENGHAIGRTGNYDYAEDLDNHDPNALRIGGFYQTDDVDVSGITAKRSRIPSWRQVADLEAAVKGAVTSGELDGAIHSVTNEFYAWSVTRDGVDVTGDAAAPEWFPKDGSVVGDPGYIGGIVADDYVESDYELFAYSELDDATEISWYAWGQYDGERHKYKAARRRTELGDRLFQLREAVGRIAGEIDGASSYAVEDKRPGVHWQLRDEIFPLSFLLHGSKITVDSAHRHLLSVSVDAVMYGGSRVFEVVGTDGGAALSYVGGLEASDVMFHGVYGVSVDTVVADRLDVVAVDDRTVNSVTVSRDSRLMFPHAVSGKSRDLVVYVSGGGPASIMDTDAGGAAVTVLGQPDLSTGSVVRFTEIEQDTNGNEVVSAVFGVFDYGAAESASALADAAVSREELRVGYTRWEVFSELPLPYAVVPDVVDGGSSGLALFPAGSTNRSDSARCSSVLECDDFTTRLSWAADSTVFGVSVSAERVLIPTIEDIYALTGGVVKLTVYATNNYELASLANNRAKAIEAWQYTNAVTRADLERGMTDWAVTPMWPLGRVEVGQVSGGPDAAKWSLFRPGAARTRDNALFEPIFNASPDPDKVTDLEWADVPWEVDARYTNALSSAGIAYDQPSGGKVVAHLDVKAKRIPISIGSGSGAGAMLDARNNLVISSAGYTSGSRNFIAGNAYGAADEFTVAAHAEGQQTTVGGSATHAEGWCSTATGYATHAEGFYTRTSGEYTHAEGSRSAAAGYAAHAEGYGTFASNVASHADGAWAHATNDTAFVWNGVGVDPTKNQAQADRMSYGSHGPGTFNISPVGGLAGFWVGETTMETIFYTVARAATNYADAAIAKMPQGITADGVAAIVTNEVAQPTGEYRNSLGLARLSDLQAASAAKADKAVPAAAGNFAALDENGNLVDSGHGHSDYVVPADIGDVVRTSGSSMLALGTGADATAPDSFAAGNAVKYEVWLAGTATVAQVNSIDISNLANKTAYVIEGEPGWITNQSDAASYPLYVVAGAAIMWNSDGRWNALTDKSLALGEGSVALSGGMAQSQQSVAVGGAISSGWRTFAEGGTHTQALGDYSHAEGDAATSVGKASHAEGGYTVASGDWSHAEGNMTEAVGKHSHAEGYRSKSFGQWSHAEGNSTIASNSYAHAEGDGTVASGIASRASGKATVASGNYASAGGYESRASGNGSHAEGHGSSATGSYSHAEGDNTLASGTSSHAEGQRAAASGGQSHAEGRDTESTGQYSHAEGINSKSYGYGSHAEGYGCVASNSYAHAEGQSSKALGNTSHAEGIATIASGDYSHAEGRSTKAEGQTSSARGYQCYTTAIATNAWAGGINATANAANCFVWNGDTTRRTGSTQGRFYVFTPVGASGVMIGGGGSATSNLVDIVGSISSSKASAAMSSQAFTNSVKAIAASATPVSTDKTYAMFVIPLNFPGDAATYCDIELKASTNNFSASAESRLRAVYYSHTSLAPEALNTDGIRIYAENISGDMRSYTKINVPAQGLPADERIPVLVAIVSRDVCMRSQGGEWLYEDNDELVWTYCRSSAGGRENDSAGRALWRPIAPVKWFSKLPEWAK